MTRKYVLDKKYIYFPVQPGYDERLIEAFGEINGKRQKLMEFWIPMNFQKQEVYKENFFSVMPVDTIKRDGGLPDSISLEGDGPESFFDAIFLSDDKPECDAKRPAIHFTPSTGWCNDPNGLVYQDGIYHLYFQYNPFDIKWNNMSWGHAISRDLLHWKQLDTVLIPDDLGTEFSGSGIVNEHGLLGLPKHALLFFYTSAGSNNPWSKGKMFTQRMAYSQDGGRTLQKMPSPYLETIVKENRDPKVFWHEESSAYIMVLWIDGCEYGIFRSEDLKNWTQIQQLFFEGTWECPDLFPVHSADGDCCWIFWTADGFYYPGQFDGYCFKDFGEKHRAYLNGRPHENGLAYAAQTYSNTGDRRISVPWLRLKNDGRPYTGAQGIPLELSLSVREGQHYLIQKPVRELWDYATEKEEDGAILVKTAFEDEIECLVDDTKIYYDGRVGILTVGDVSYETEAGHREMVLIADDIILEIFLGQGQEFGAFQLDKSAKNVMIEKNDRNSCQIYHVK